MKDVPMLALVRQVRGRCGIEARFLHKDNVGSCQQGLLKEGSSFVEAADVALPDQQRRRWPKRVVRPRIGLDTLLSEVSLLLSALCELGVRGGGARLLTADDRDEDMRRIGGARGLPRVGREAVAGAPCCAPALEVGLLGQRAGRCKSADTNRTVWSCTPKTVQTRSIVTSPKHS